MTAVDVWTDLDGIAKYFSVSPSTIIRWEKQGFPYHKFGRIKRYCVEECDKWFKERSVHA